MRTIGILGGVGPEATAYIYMKMVNYCLSKYMKNSSIAFPRITIYSLALPNVAELNEIPEETLRELKLGIEKLKLAGADFTFVACNSVENFLPTLRKNTEVLSIVEETAKEVKRLGLKRIGLLATQTTLENKSYQEKFRQEGIELVLPKNQQLVTNAIQEILDGKKQEPKEKLLDIINELDNIDAVALACTDLPLIIEQKNIGIPLLDTAEIIAKAAVKKYYERR